jgi:phosphatidylglycerophosphate synthase
MIVLVVVCIVSLYELRQALLVSSDIDAVDGKQARRTNSSSPLGELFDHGISKSFLLLLSTVHKAAVKLPFEIYSHVC